jgi:hypothetical protein
MENIQESSERFVDESSSKIPAQDTWNDLSVNELYDIQSNFRDKILGFKSNPAAMKVLNTALSNLEKLIESKSSKY